MVIAGSVTGFGNIAVNQGRTRVTGHVDSSFLGIGLVAGTPATLELGAGQTSHISLLGISGSGTLATDVTATGEVGQVVARSTAYVRGTLELDVQPGTYGATTVYNDVVTAPGLRTTPGTTFKRVTTDTPGFTAAVTYDNGTADVTLTRTGSTAVATASLASTAATSQNSTVKNSRSANVGHGDKGQRHTSSLASGGGHKHGQGSQGGNHDGGKHG
jgi:hypothetical protein